jgi:hypothetical protein
MAFMMNGCSDFLEPDSLSTFDTGYIFSNIDDARLATNSIYTQFSTDGFTTRLSTNMQANTDIEVHGADPALIHSKPNIEIEMLDPVASNTDIVKAWDSGYKAITACNIVIDGIRKSGNLESIDPNISSNMYQFLGEAYTVRAYWYSMLINSFGDIPFSTLAPSPDVNFNIPKEDRMVILSSVIRDLIDIEPKMKWADELPHGIEQVNREFTLGMIAKLALQRGGYYLKPDMTLDRKGDYLDYYAIARDYSKKLISLKDRALPADFAQIFRNESQYIVAKNSDVLFEIPFAIGEGDIGYNVGIQVAEGGPNGYTTGGYAIPASYYYSFDQNDVRRAVTCGLYNRDAKYITQLVSISAISQGKWSREYLAPGTSTTKGTGINFPLLRYADVLLMNAEAENELSGPSADAQESLSRVRRRAFNTVDWPTKVNQYVTNVASSKQVFFDAIVDERAWEFGGEFTRRFDLIRWGNYDKIIAKTITKLKALGDESTDTNGVRPDYVYWSRNADGTIKIFSTDTRVIPTDVANWTRTTWLANLKSSTGIGGYQNWISWYWVNYTNSVRYIMPIPASAVTSSQGVLKNDGYGYN